MVACIKKQWLPSVTHVHEPDGCALCCMVYAVHSIPTILHGCMDGWVVPVIHAPRLTAVLCGVHCLTYMLCRGGSQVLVKGRLTMASIAIPNINAGNVSCPILSFLFIFTTLKIV